MGVRGTMALLARRAFPGAVVVAALVFVGTAAAQAPLPPRPDQPPATSTPPSPPAPPAATNGSSSGGSSLSGESAVSGAASSSPSAAERARVARARGEAARRAAAARRERLRQERVAAARRRAALRRQAAGRQAVALRAASGAALTAVDSTAGGLARSAGTRGVSSAGDAGPLLYLLIGLSLLGAGGAIVGWRTLRRRRVLAGFRTSSISIDRADLAVLGAGAVVVVVIAVLWQITL